MADAPYQSLYRRFRPQRFDEVLGQDHVALALRNAVASDRVAHAYLFSGPRGTGKTSTARILAKVLNCAKPEEGEPCRMCDSCVSAEKGTSVTVFELDAASNNGVDEIRDLTARASLGTSGNKKVYIVDEVHMLSKPAANALLKTLEEPPEHVVFVLATTDPQKVLPTILSRTQHFEFRLLPAGALTQLMAQVNEAAELNLPVESLEAAIRRGKGSARDALSALDQVAAGGGAEDADAHLDQIIEGLISSDTGAVLTGVAEAIAGGREARRLAEDLVAQLREAFLATLAPALVSLGSNDAEKVADQGRRLGARGITRALEAISGSMGDMRLALDPRVSIEVALVKLCQADTDASPAGLADRIDRLERAIAGGAVGAAGPSPAPAQSGAGAPARGPAPSGSPAPRTSPEPAGRSGGSGPAGARAALGALRKREDDAPAPPAPPSVADSPPPSPQPPAAQATTGDGPMPSRDDLTKAWGDHVLPGLPPKAKARFGPGHFIAVDGQVAVMAFPNKIHRDRCEEVRADVESALGQHFGTKVGLRLEVDSAAPADRTPAPPPEIDRIPSAHELEDAPSADSVSDRLKKVFPGAEEV